MKLKAIKAKVAQQAGDSKGDYSSKTNDLERPLLQNRTKDDILSEIHRLQEEMGGNEGRIKAYGRTSGLSSINTARGLNGSSGVLEHRSSPAAAAAAAAAEANTGRL